MTGLRALKLRLLLGIHAVHDWWTKAEATLHLRLSKERGCGGALEDIYLIGRKRRQAPSLQRPISRIIEM
jgi:hypothetical protein